VELLVLAESVDSFSSSFLFPRPVVSAIAGLEEAKNRAGENPPPDSDLFSDAEFGKNLANLSNQFAVSATRRFQFNKRSQQFLCVHNEPLSVTTYLTDTPTMERRFHFRTLPGHGRALPLESSHSQKERLR
jgi:hypothetical protein